jgi:hypothetical protein
MHRKKLYHFGNTRRHSYNPAPPGCGNLRTRAFTTVGARDGGYNYECFFSITIRLSASRMAASLAVFPAGAPRRSERAPGLS